MTDETDIDQVLKDLATKSDGFMRCAIVDPDHDLLQLIQDAADGHALAPRLLAAVAAFAKDLGEPSDKPRRCLLCPALLSVANTNRYVVLFCDDATVPRLTMGLCPDCSPRASIDDVVEKLRGIWTTLRRLDIHPGAGHA